MKMKNQCQQLQEKLTILLQKSSDFSQREIFALWTIFATILGSASFSLTAVSRNFGREIGRNFLTKVLKKYSGIQKVIVKEFLKTLCNDLTKKQKIYLIIDDTLLRKRGRCIFGSFLWYDHTISRQIQSICLVNLVIVVEGHLVMILPWILVNKLKKTKKKKKKKKEQDGKTKRAIKMLNQIVLWLDEFQVTRNRIVVEADSWFSSKPMLDFVRQMGLIYRIDGKKNYSVQVPDKEAIKKAKTQKRGRKRRKFVKYTPLKEYLGASDSWAFFTNKPTKEQIRYRSAIISLKTGGRTKIYAFKRKGSKNPKFILTNAKKNRPPTQETVYRDYSYRWRVEEAHRDLKQQFGIQKAQNRQEKVVHGFIHFISMMYSIWKLWAWKAKKILNQTYSCPSWSERFHKYQIKYVFDEPV